MSIEARLAQIEANQTNHGKTLDKIELLVTKNADRETQNTLDIALLKRDAKWRSTIIASVGGFFGIIGSALFKFFEGKGG